MIKRVRNYFITGLVVLLPVFTTFYFIFWIFATADRILRPLIPYQIPGLGLLAGLILIFVAGIFGKNVLGRRLIGSGEWIMQKIPFVKQIYATLKQIMDAFFNQSAMKAFQTVVLVEYPRKGIFQLGFLTSEGMEKLQQAAGLDLVNVFLPTTPNPTSGMLVLVPRTDIIYPDLTVEEGVKLILSGGVIASKDKEVIEGSELEGAKN